jgi:DNA-binding SARP family transcriptional activator
MGVPADSAAEVDAVNTAGQCCRSAAAMLLPAAVPLPFCVCTVQRGCRVTDDPVQFQILGDLRAVRADATLELGPAKQRAVLAVLLLNAGRPVPVTQIVDAVWGEEPPENGANVVQKYVAGLRRILDPSHAPRTPGELLPLTSAGYTLRIEPAAVDALRFEAGMAQASALRKSGQFPEAAAELREALALWHGEALAGLSGPVFDAARTRLTEARATAWEKWAEIELARGNHTGVMPDLARLVEQFPLREGLRSHLMVALHQGGRQAEALAVFRDAREYYLEEFGVEPGEMLQEIHRKILRGEQFYTEPVDPWAGHEAAAPTSPAPASPGPVGYVSSYVPPDRTVATPPPSSWGPQSYSPQWDASPPSWEKPSWENPPPSWESAPPAWESQVPLPPRVPRGFPVGEVIFAALVPILICSVGSWIYFVYAGAYRRDRRQFLFAAGYLALFVISCIVFSFDPSPPDSDQNSTIGDISVTMWFAIALSAAVHGAFIAAHPGDSPRARGLRGQARLFAAYNPEQAVRLAVGRPDLTRWYDDGGMIDLNNAPSHVLSQLRGITPDLAQRIAMGRAERPYSQPEELVFRGFLTSKKLHRIASWLICLPPQPTPTATQWGAAHPHGY